MQQYWTISDHIEQYRTSSYHIRPYWTISFLIKPYQTILECIRPYRTITDHIGQYWTVCMMGPWAQYGLLRSRVRHIYFSGAFPAVVETYSEAVESFDVRDRLDAVKATLSKMDTVCGFSRTASDSAGPCLLLPYQLPSSATISLNRVYRYGKRRVYRASTKTEGDSGKQPNRIINVVAVRRNSIFFSITVNYSTPETNKYEPSLGNMEYNRINLELKLKLDLILKIKLKFEVENSETQPRTRCDTESPCSASGCLNQWTTRGPPIELLFSRGFELSVLLPSQLSQFALRWLWCSVQHRAFIPIQAALLGRKFFNVRQEDAQLLSLFQSSQRLVRTAPLLDLVGRISEIARSVCAAYSSFENVHVLVGRKNDPQLFFAGIVEQRCVAVAERLPFHEPYHYQYSIRRIVEEYCRIGCPYFDEIGLAYSKDCEIESFARVAKESFRVALDSFDSPFLVRGNRKIRSEFSSRRMNLRDGCFWLRGKRCASDGCDGWLWLNKHRLSVRGALCLSRGFR
ncbi:unnamed protein product, partial [Nesidiocoris tenuis]